MKYLEHRIPPPLIATCAAISMWVINSMTNPIVLDNTIKHSVVSLFFVTGIAFSALGLICFRAAKTTINPLNPEQASSLVTSGVYKITRNPMYVGMAIVLCAWAVYLSSLWSVSIIAIFIVYIHIFQILPEEKALKNIFGQAFIDYKNQVRPWL